MGFKLPGKSIISGTSAHRSALKMRADENAASALKQRVKGGTKTWKQGEKAAESTGRDLNALVTERKKYKKGSDEYNAVQNQINKALGSKKRHGVTTEATDTRGKKTSDVKTTPGVGTKTVTEKTRPSGEVKKKVTEFDREEGYGGETKRVEKFRKGGGKKSLKVVKEDLKTKKGTTDKTVKIKYTKEGVKKKSKVKFKTDTDDKKGHEIKGKVKRKYDDEGNLIKTKQIEREGGRRTVTTTKDGVTTTKSRRTLKGFLTGKGKKKKEEENI